MNGFAVGELTGAFFVAALLPVLALIVYRLPPLRRRLLQAYVVAAALVWWLPLAAISGSSSEHKVALYLFVCYLVLVALYWGYRRAAKRPPSGWARLHALWHFVVVGGVLFAVLASPDLESAYVAGTFFGGAVLVASFALRWVIAGFKSKTAA